MSASILQTVAAMSPCQMATATAVGLLGLLVVSSLLPAKKKSVVGKVVVITGAGSGLGRLFTKRFLNLGAKVAVLDVNVEGARTTVEEARAEYKAKTGKEAPEDALKAYALDVTNRAQCFDVLAAVEREMGPIYLLFNNAGIVVGKKCEDLTEKDVRRTMDVNCLGSIWTTQAVLPNLISRRSGHLVYLASAAGTAGMPMLTDYCASKGAQNLFADALREELRVRDRSLRDLIPVTVINPSFINTGMFAGVKAEHPILPMLTPEHVVNCAMNAILSDKGVIGVPFMAEIAPLLRATLSFRMRQWLVDTLQLDNAMNGFVGRGGH